MKKFFLTTAILLLAAACNNQQAQVQPVQNQPAPTAQAVQTQPTPTSVQQQAQATPTVIENVNLKTYTNSQYGFEFQYPTQSIKLKNCDTTNLKYDSLVFVECMYAIPPSIYAPDYDGYIGIFKLPLDQALQSIGYGKGALSTTKTINYNGINWTILPTENSPGHYFTERNGQTVWLNTASTIKQADLETILNSFKFTK